MGGLLAGSEHSRCERTATRYASTSCYRLEAGTCGRSLRMLSTSTIRTRIRVMLHETRILLSWTSRIWIPGTCSGPGLFCSGPGVRICWVSEPRGHFPMRTRPDPLAMKRELPQFLSPLGSECLLIAPRTTVQVPYKDLLSSIPAP